MDDFVEKLTHCVPNLRRYARALMRDRDRADDLVQDCLERALSRRHLWNGPGNMRAWLMTIMHNLYANEMRRLSTRPWSMPLEAADGAGARHADQIAIVSAREMMVAMDQLADEQRQTILLVAIEGMTYQETAETLGIAVGTVMSRLSRGRARLRALTDDTGPQKLRRVK